MGGLFSAGTPQPVSVEAFTEAGAGPDAQRIKWIRQNYSDPNVAEQMIRAESQPNVTRYRAGGQVFNDEAAARAFVQGAGGGGGNSNVYTFTDPYTGKSYNIPRVTVRQTLTPEGQRVQDATVQTQINMAELGRDQSSFLQDYLSKPFRYNPGEHEQWATGLYDKINGDALARDEETLRTNLANRGVGAGSTAYGTAVSNFEDGKQTARDRFMLDSYNTGMNTAVTNRQQPINEIISLLSGSQLQQPNFVNANIAGIPTTDNAGIIMDDYKTRLGIHQQKQAQRQAMMGGILGTAGTLLSAPAGSLGASFGGLFR